MRSSTEIPDRIGRCRIVSVLGRGATATVYRAIQEGPRGFEHEVALKLFDPTLVASQPAIVGMIVDEARIASRLNHPGIVRILDLVEEEGQLYTLMDCVDGPSMRQILDAARLARCTPDPAVVTLVLAEACKGLHAAHTTPHPDGSASGLVHRDIKPGNILIASNGDVKLSDFGIALFAGRVAEATAHGQLKGTPAYMSPEQVFGEPMDARSDIFSMGLTLFTLCTTRLAFTGSSPMKIAVRIAEEPMESQAAELDALLPGLGDIFDRACAKEPADRYATAAELGEALTAIYDGLDNPAGVLDLLSTWSPRMEDEQESATDPNLPNLAESTEDEEQETDPNLAHRFATEEDDDQGTVVDHVPAASRGVSPGRAGFPDLVEEPTQENPDLGHLSQSPRPTPVHGLKPLGASAYLGTMPNKAIDVRPDQPEQREDPPTQTSATTTQSAAPSRPERDYRGRVIHRKTIDPKNLEVSKTERVAVIGMAVLLLLLVLAILIAYFSADSPQSDVDLAPDVESVPAPPPAETDPGARPSRGASDADQGSDEIPPPAPEAQKADESTPAPKAAPAAKKKSSSPTPKNRPPKAKRPTEPIEAQPEAAVAPPGRLTVNTYPYSQVWVDGVARGRTPLQDLPLPIGLHEVKMVFPTLGDLEEVQTIRIQTDQTKTLFKRVTNGRE
jgi:serine/threonine protein kinase